MSNMYTEPSKLSFWLDAPVYASLVREARFLGREPIAHIQRLLIERVMGGSEPPRSEIVLDQASIDDYRLMWGLVDRAKETARLICREGGFDAHITYRTVQA